MNCNVIVGKFTACLLISNIIHSTHSSKSRDSDVSQLKIDSKLIKVFIVLKNSLTNKTFLLAYIEVTRHF